MAGRLPISRRPLGGRFVDRGLSERRGGAPIEALPVRFSPAGFGGIGTAAAPRGAIVARVRPGAGRICPSFRGEIINGWQRIEEMLYRRQLVGLLFRVARIGSTSRALLIVA